MIAVDGRTSEARGAFRAATRWSHICCPAARRLPGDAAAEAATTASTARTRVA